MPSISTDQLIETLDIDALLMLAREAGRIIMTVYQSDDWHLEAKADQSPVTRADKEANTYIVSGLEKLAPGIPILAEESASVPYEARKDWPVFWLVDPLDGTKEFINRRDEFTVNIALVLHGVPIFGLVYAPALERLYWAQKGQGAFYLEKEGAESLRLPVYKGGAFPEQGRLRIIGSRSHRSEALENYLAALENRYDEVAYIPSGSALKFCLLAEGLADMYPRLGPTQEWDTAAGHAILLETGRNIYQWDTDKPLAYNKPNLANPWFICK